MPADCGSARLTCLDKTQNAKNAGGGDRIVHCRAVAIKRVLTKTKLYIINWYPGGIHMVCTKINFSDNKANKN